jgi:hypothetical protein
MNRRADGFRGSGRPMAWLAGGIGAAVVVLMVAGLSGQGSPERGQDRNEARVARGFELAPVPLDLEGKNPALVGLGSYLVNTLHCSDCHTNPPFAPGGNPFMGQPERINTENYLAGGTPFGPFTSRNITPRPATGLPAGYALDEFIHVMRTGEDLKNRHPQISPLLQVMPWPWYKDLTDRELHAMYEYLRAIPSARRAE